MPKITRVITDVDECLLAYRPGFLEVNPGYEDIFVFPTDLNEAFRNSENLKHLKPMPGAVEFVKALNHAGIPIDIVTSLGNEPAARENRLHNLNQVFGEGAFDNIHILPYRVSKTEALAKLGYDPATTAFVDDYIVHLNESPYVNIWHFVPENNMPDATAEQLKVVTKKVDTMDQAAEFILGYGGDPS